ncbi:MAG TPA: ATP-grasp domain-containing protein [Candidatus Tectomicrobia bacterium]
MMDSILIVGAGMLQVPMFREAQSLGLAVLATDGNPAAPGAAVADAFFPVDTYDVDGHRQLGQMLRDHQHWKLRGVVTTGADVAPSVAAAAQGAGVRGIPLEIAQLTHDKALVREALYTQRLDCFQPKWARVSPHLSSHDQLTIARVAYKIGFPCIVKPLEERASRGVSFVHDLATYEQAKQKALAYGETFLLEEVLVGTEHSTEIIIGDKGETLWRNIVDRYFDYSSGVPIELGHANPTILHPTQRLEIYSMVYAAVRALGVTWGPFKVDCMLTADGPKVLECTARLSGGFDSQWTCPATGRHPMRVLLQLACGLPIEPQFFIDQADGYAAAVAILPTRAGILEEIATPAGREGEVAWAVSPGQRIGPLQHNAERCGYVFTHATTQQAAWAQGMQRAQECAEWMRINDV